MRTIPLTQGKVALVDDADYDWLSQWKWQAQRRDCKTLPPRFYAVRMARVAGRAVLIAMHALISRTPPGMDTDHIDHDGLNNQRNNLRVVTHSVNMLNARRCGRLPGPRKDQREPNRLRLEALRREAKAKGLCGRYYCDSPVVANRTQCAVHLADDRRRDAERRRKAQVAA